MTPYRTMRRFASGLAGLALLLTVAACGGDDASDKKGTLTFWTWVPGIDKAVELYNNTHSDVTIKLEKITAGPSGGYAKMHQALEAKQAPCLAQVEYQEIPSFLLEKGLVDVTGHVGATKTQFVDWQWEQVAYGGKIYAVPQASGPMGLFYRDDLFRQWGIGVPTTWPEFRTAAERIRQSDPNAYIATFPPGNSAWFAALAWQAGARWFSVEGDTWIVNMTDANTIRTAEYWQDMISRKLVKTEPDFADAWYKDLQEGHIVSWPSAQWGDAILRGNAPGTAGKWRAAYMPQWTAGGKASANWGGSSTAVFTGCSDVKKAADFAKWLNTDPESIKLLLGGGYGWPAAKAGYDSPALKTADQFFGGQVYNEVFAESDRNVKTDWRWIPGMQAAYNHLNDGFRGAVEGKGTLADAVRAAQEKIVADLKAKGLQVRTG